MDNYNETDERVYDLIESGKIDLIINIVDSITAPDNKEVAVLYRKDIRSGLQKFGCFNYDPSEEMINLYVSMGKGIDYAALTLVFRKLVKFFSGTGYIFGITLQYIDSGEDKDRIKKVIAKELKDFKLFVSNK